MSFARHDAPRCGSFPRRRESTPQAIRTAPSTDWIPAFAGMTYVSKATSFQMTPRPRRGKWHGIASASSGFVTFLIVGLFLELKSFVFNPALRANLINSQTLRAGCGRDPKRLERPPVCFAVILSSSEGSRSARLSALGLWLLLVTHHSPLAPVLNHRIIEGFSDG